MKGENLTLFSIDFSFHLPIWFYFNICISLSVAQEGLWGRSGAQGRRNGEKLLRLRGLQKREASRMRQGSRAWETGWKGRKVSKKTCFWGGGKKSVGPCWGDSVSQNFGFLMVGKAVLPVESPKKVSSHEW